MSKKNNLSKPDKVNPKSAETNFWILPAGIALLTFVVYYRILTKGFDFLNWDDPSFVLGNNAITELSFKNIKLMFTTFFVGNYCPLTIFSYAIDYSFSGLNPKMFHFTNLLIHLINTILVYLFAYNLTNKKTMIAGVASFLFALHPMHIESVAWVAERRDVLYCMFYLGALNFYLIYITRGYQTKYLVYTMLLFVGSLLSKGQAVTLPVIMVLLDYFYSRKLLEKKLILEKAPFFILSLVFGYVAILAQQSTPALNVFNLSKIHTLFIGNYGLMLYLVKAFVPFQLSGFHPYPFSTGAESLPASMYISPIVILGVLFFVYKKFKTDKIIISGVLFFLITIFPVLQFLPLGETILAERYTYIPYIGLFIIVGYIFNDFAHFKLNQSVRYIIGIYMVFMLAITWARVPLWKGSLEFWSDVIEQYPESRTAYNNRGYQYNQLTQYDLAIADLTKGIQCDPKYGRLYLNRAVSYDRKKMFDMALADYTKSIELDSTEIQNYVNRGVIYTDVLNQYDLGIKDFKKVLTMDSLNLSAMSNLGIAYYKKGDYPNSIIHYNQYLNHKKDNGQIYYFRALVYFSMKNFKKAVEDAEKAKQLGFGVDELQLQTWRSQAMVSPAQ